MALCQLKSEAFALSPHGKRLFGGGGDVQLYTLQVVDVPVHDGVATPQHGVGHKAGGQITTESRDVDDIRHLVSLAEHVASHHVLGLVANKVGGRQFLVGE